MTRAGYAERAELFCCSHSEAGIRINEKIQAFTMNLGYLPGGDKQIVTRRESTIEALRALTELLSPGAWGLFSFITDIRRTGGKGGCRKFYGRNAIRLG